MKFYIWSDSFSDVLANDDLLLVVISITQEIYKMLICSCIIYNAQFMSELHVCNYGDLRNILYFEISASKNIY